MRADDQCRRFVQADMLGLDEDVVVGRSRMRQIDHGSGRRRVGGDRHEMRRRRDLAGVLLIFIRVIDDGEVGIRRIVDLRNTPATAAIEPSSPNSPSTVKPLKASGGIAPIAAISPSAIGRS